MKKHDMKVEECFAKSEEVAKFFAKFDETVSYKSEVNPVISKFKRELQNMMVVQNSEKIEKEKLLEYTPEEDIFLSEEPIRSRINGNMLEYYKSIFHVVKHQTDADQLEKLKQDIQAKIDKFSETALYHDNEDNRRLEAMQKLKLVRELKKLLQTEIQQQDQEMWDLLSKRSGGMTRSKSRWKKLSKNMAKSIARPDRMQKTVMTAFKMGVQRANSRKIRDKPNGLLVPKRRRGMRSPKLERRQLTIQVICKF